MSLKILTDNNFFDYFIELTEFIRRRISSLTCAIQDSRSVVHVVGKFRRWYLVQFRKQYVLQQMLVRKGYCRQCGTCCCFLFTCPMLTKRRRCLIYGTCRPAACKLFPIDQRDIHEVELCGGACGYRFSPAAARRSGQFHRIRTDEWIRPRRETPNLSLKDERPTSNIEP